MSIAVAKITHIRGETITFGLRSDPPYDGTETVTCDLKVALNGNAVPPENEPVVVSALASFQNAAWLFSLTSEQSAALSAGAYITDARIEYVGGAVDYPLPLVVAILERVTT